MQLILISSAFIIICVVVMFIIFKHKKSAKKYRPYVHDKDQIKECDNNLYSWHKDDSTW